MREKPFYFFFEAFVAAAAAATHRCKFLKRQIEWNIYARLDLKREKRQKKKKEKKDASFFKNFEK